MVIVMFTESIKLIEVSFSFTCANCCEGEYLGLTGTQLDGTEMLVSGLATHFVLSKVRHFEANLRTSHY